MKSNLKVKIQADKSCQEEYIIKDNNDIIIGRFKILELNCNSKRDIIIGRFKILELNSNRKRGEIRLNFYRQSSYELLTDALSLILKAIFKNHSVYKVNIRALEGINVNAFLNSGFTLEGVLIQNEYCKGEYLDELSFGITRNEYSKERSYPIIELEGKNVILRNLTPGDAEELLEYYKRNKNYLAPFEPARDSSFYTLENQTHLLNESYRQLLNGTNIELGIFKNDKLIGKVKLSNIVYGSLKSGILGYSIDEEEQGNGYMKESVRLLLDYVFNECELDRVGFKLAVINEKYLLVNGKWQDHATYYIIKDYFNNMN